jgi:hypothetical protein
MGHLTIGLHDIGTSLPYWDQQSLASSFNTMALRQPQNIEWYFHSGATSHMTSDAGILSCSSLPRYPVPS